MITEAEIQEFEVYTNMRNKLAHEMNKMLIEGFPEEIYKNYATISFIFDKNKITGYKSSPIDEGPEKFLQLFKERVLL